MLQLQNIVKQYSDVSGITTAVDNITLSFRQHEFVSILGPSGCGKTSLLNIIGGLDKYDSGNLIINNVSTRNFSEKQWNNYRNNSVGFVFQSYNLITHQSVFRNVELALTLSGVSKKDRKQRVLDVLTRVGLENHIHKKPNQLSGGQMQRVAIARALVNSPDIILADEPTGALDSENSDMIMKLLKDISKDHLVIVVTHNPDLAKTYSTRIIKLSSGKLIKDSNPHEPKHSHSVESLKRKIHNKMTFLSALTLSFSNLLTKKTRAFLTTVAGSIGIIGIALVLSVSAGVNAYIADVERDTLMANPVTIQRENQDFSAVLSSMLSSAALKDPESYDSDKIYVNNSMSKVFNSKNNNTGEFYDYIQTHYSEISEDISSIKYTYDVSGTLFTSDGSKQIHPSPLFSSIDNALDDVSGLLSSMSNVSLSVLSEMIDNQVILNQQYELLGNSQWPSEANEVVLVIDKNNELNKVSLYMLGLISYEDVMSDETIEPYTIESFIGKEFKLVNTCDFYVKTDYSYVVDDTEYPVWQDIRKGIYDQEKFVEEHGMSIRITGVVKPKSTTTASSITGLLGHTSKLTDYMLKYAETSEVVVQQQSTPEYNVLTGIAFERKQYTKETIHELVEKVDDHVMSQIYTYIAELLTTDEEFAANFAVSDSESFNYFFSIQTLQQKQKIIADMIEYATLSGSSHKVDVLLSQFAYSGIEITKNNIVTLLPILSEEEQFYLIMGPDQQSGLLSICGEEYTNSLFYQCSESIKTATIDHATFLMFLKSGFITDNYFETIEEMLYDLAPQKDATYDTVLQELGHADKSNPAAISFYANTFEARDAIETFIDKYNTEHINPIHYTDVTKSVLDVIHSIIVVVSCVLIAFISISLLVSSLMIGVITYVSVLERRKEIGILRAVGASRADIRRIFNAETFLIGLSSGVLGVTLTSIGNILINKILVSATSIPNLHASLSVLNAAFLIGTSILLTFIAGLIPSSIASKLNPVESLRSE